MRFVNSGCPRPIAICSRVRTQVTVGRGAGGAGGAGGEKCAPVGSNCPNLTEYSYN